MAKFTFIDLFAGIGGFRIALSNAGGTCLGFSEIAPDAIKAYCTNYNEPESCNLGDITKLKTLPEHDFMTAGVPCQSWSIAGKKLGFDDDRGQLWNDTLYLLNKVRPKAFIFENVKGLADPRNSEALKYIMSRIREAGYHAEKYILNAYDYGVPQTRVRIYIIGFLEEKYHKRFRLPDTCPGAVRLSDILDGAVAQTHEPLSGNKARWSLSCNEQGFNDYFLFNDIRNGSTTIHTWDIVDTTEREKHICLLLLSNRRKKEYGPLDGNPLTLNHFKGLDPSIKKSELDTLVKKGILKDVPYLYRVIINDAELTENEQLVMSFSRSDILNIDELKLQRVFRVKGIGIVDTIEELETRGIIECVEARYDFKHARISSGINGINRIFLKSSKIYPTMVASDTNDYIATVDIDAPTVEEFKEQFLEKIYRPHNYRQITKSEACRIQGFPDNFILPEARPRWMKLIGNSIAVSLVKRLAQSVVNTGVFSEDDYIMNNNMETEEEKQGLLFETNELFPVDPVDFGETDANESISDYVVKAASFQTNAKGLLRNVRTLADQFNTLGAFKRASLESLRAIRNQEGSPLVKPFGKQLADLITSIQAGIDETKSLGDNFIFLLTSRFILRQLDNIDEISLEKINANPLLCTTLKLETVDDLIKFNVYALATRSIVTAMGFLIQDLLLYSSPNAYPGKNFEEGKKVKWDIVVEKIGAVRSYIEVKSGPNDLDAGQVKSYQEQIEEVESNGHKGYIGISYGKRGSKSVSFGLFKQYLNNWEERTLIGTELWDFVSGCDSYHEQLMEMLQFTASEVLNQESVIRKIEGKIVQLCEEFNKSYGSIEDYFKQLW